MSVSFALVSVCQSGAASKQALTALVATLDRLAKAALQDAAAVGRARDQVAEPDSADPAGSPVAGCWAAVQEDRAAARSALAAEAGALEDLATEARAEARTVAGLAEALPVVTLPACPQCESTACPTAAEADALAEADQRMGLSSDAEVAASISADPDFQQRLAERLAQLEAEEAAFLAEPPPPDGVKEVVEEVDAAAAYCPDCGQDPCVCETVEAVLAAVDAAASGQDFADHQKLADALAKEDELLGVAANPSAAACPAPPLVPAEEVAGASPPSQVVELEPSGKKPRARGRRKGGA
jgi:hypothetical protein